MIEFKPYCWCLGNTSFRVADLNYKNEIQLRYLDELFNAHPDDTWRDLQVEYYNLLSKYGFKNGKAARPDKDARELTSGLADIGLIYRDTRESTPVGNAITAISESGNFTPDNPFGISRDSYVYLLQLLKYQIRDEDDVNVRIKPFVALIYMICHLGKLSRDQFTYLLPVCMSVSDVLNATSYATSDKAIDSFLTLKMMSMPNYREAHELLTKAGEVTENIIETVGVNRKSPKYDKPMFGVYQALHQLWKDANSDDATKTKDFNSLRSSLKDVNDNQSTPWKQMFGITKNATFSESDFLVEKYHLPLLSSTSEFDFRDRFFKLWQLFKWKSTLEDYYDLNKRYLNLTDVVKYDLNEFTLTETAKLYFQDIIDKILLEPLLTDEKYEALLTSVVPIESISKECHKTNDDIATLISQKYGKQIDGASLEEYLKQLRNDEFKKVIAQRFPKSVILELLDCFKVRNDDRIGELVSHDASAPTAFEYIVGTIWYELSGEEGCLEDCMNLTMDANYLPKQHAGGNTPDLRFIYKAKSSYPEHSLIVEATLSEEANQRHMEWEPVVRHLECQIHSDNNQLDYAVFVAGLSYSPTIKSFRAMKLYDVELDKGGVANLKVIPLDCDLLKAIVSKSLNYETLYRLFADAYSSEKNNMEWFNSEIENQLI